MITSWKIFPANLMIKRTVVSKSSSGCYRSQFRNLRICWLPLNFNENIYQITHDDIFQHQKIDCSFKSLFRLTTKKASRHRISGLLWGESTADWIVVLPKHHNQLHLTQFWIQMDIYELIFSQLLTTIQVWRYCVNISYHSDVTWGIWRHKSPEIRLLFLDPTKVTSQLSIIDHLWGESTVSYYYHYHYFHHYH